MKVHCSCGAPHSAWCLSADSTTASHFSWCAPFCREEGRGGGGEGGGGGGRKRGSRRCEHEGAVTTVVIRARSCVPSVVRRRCHLPVLPQGGGTWSSRRWENKRQPTRKTEGKMQGEVGLTSPAFIAIVLPAYSYLPWWPAGTHGWPASTVSLSTAARPAISP